LNYGVEVVSPVIMVSAVPGMASQAQDCGRLLQQIVGDRAVRRMAVRTVLGHGRVLVSERALLLGVALPAQEIERFRFQVAFHLAMRVVAIAAEHLAFLHGMM
jgi:hypothetical protein